MSAAEIRLAKGTRVQPGEHGVSPTAGTASSNTILKEAAANPEAFRKKHASKIQGTTKNTDFVPISRVWMRVDRDGYAGTHAPRSPSLGDAIVVFGGLGPATRVHGLADGNSLSPVLRGDLVMMRRAVSASASGCMAPESDSLECLGGAFEEDGSSQLAAASKQKRPSAIGLHLANPHREASFLLQGTSEPIDVQDLTEADQDVVAGLAEPDGSTSDEAKALYTAASESRLGPWHYKATYEPQYWSWRWEQPSVQGDGPGPRHKHVAAAVLNELLVITGGSGYRDKNSAIASCKAARSEHGACDGVTAPLSGAVPLGDVHVLHAPSMRWLDLQVV